MDSTLYVDDAELRAKIIMIFDALYEEVPVMNLYCDISEAAVMTVKNFIDGSEDNEVKTWL